MDAADGDASSPPPRGLGELFEEGASGTHNASGAHVSLADPVLTGLFSTGSASSDAPAFRAMLDHERLQLDVGRSSHARTGSHRRGCRISRFAALDQQASDEGNHESL